MIHTCTIPTPLGPMTASAEGGALTGLWFVGQKYYPGGADGWVDDPDYPIFVKLRDYLTRYFSGEAVIPDFPLAPRGTAFQRSVWDLLLAIPKGQLVTYGGLAKSLARARGIASMSAQTVGAAVAHNPISLLIPCHRVVGSDGSLTGYAGGLDRKEALLKMERGLQG